LTISTAPGTDFIDDRLWELNSTEALKVYEEVARLLYLTEALKVYEEVARLLGLNYRAKEMSRGKY